MVKKTFETVSILLALRAVMLEQIGEETESVYNYHTAKLSLYLSREVLF